jgi:phenylacetate-CoA ligase
MNINQKSIRIITIKVLYSIKGRSTFKYLQEFERNQWLPKKEIERIQWVKLQSLLDYAYRNVPFYKKIFKDIKLKPKDIKTKDDFRKLPVLTKEGIDNNSSEMISGVYGEKDLVKNSTGGSTGRNLNFFVDGRRSHLKEIVTIRGNRWAGLDVGERHAYLWGSPFDISLQNELKNKIFNKLYGCDLFLSSYDLSEENMLSYAKKLQFYKPKVIIGYPSPLYLFAKFIEDKKIEGFETKSIISSAEALYEYQREGIESVFQCKLFNRYGSREFGNIAHECSEHSGMHINIDHVYIECLKEDGEPANPGETGELIITDLDNYAMPFIRYRIGDTGVLSDRNCNCGRSLPLLEEVGGRTFDIIVGANGRHLGGTFWTLLLRTAIEGIQQFQVVQESESKIIIKIVVNESFKSKNIDVLTKKIHQYCGENMQIIIEEVDKIPLTKSGKFRFVISKVSPFSDRLE